jgi:hypothetical protein
MKEPTDDLEELLRQVAAGGRAADEAAVELHARIQWKMRGITDGLDDQNLPPPLSDADIERLVEALLDVVESAKPPRGAVVWALGETFDPRIVVPLAQIVDEYADDPGVDEAHLVYNALSVLYNMDALDKEVLSRIAARQDDLGAHARNIMEVRFR